MPCHANLTGTIILARQQLPLSDSIPSCIRQRSTAVYFMACRMMLRQLDTFYPALTCPRVVPTRYMDIGYLASEHSDEAVSRTLAYAFDDWAIGQLAAQLNKTDDVTLFFNRSKNYRNVWHADSKFFCPRFANGSFHCNEDPGWNGWIFSDDGEQGTSFVQHGA